MAFEGLNFDVGLNARPFIDGIKTMQSQAVSFDNTVKQIGRTLMGVFGAVSVVATLKKSIELWGEQEQAMMKLSIAAQRFTRDAQGTYDRITKLSTNLQHLTGVGNETYQALGALGLSLGIAEEKIENATLAATLLSQVTGMDLNSAMKNLAKTQAGLTGELGEALPFLRELTQEQLRNGEAIDLVIQKYDGFAEQLSETTQVGVKRFWSALGDVGEVLGKSFNPLIQKAANWMEDFSSKIEKPTDILKTLKDTIKAGYEELGPFGKAVVGVGAAFLTLKVAGTAWSLLSQIVVAGGHLIVGVFKTIFSWPTLLIAGLYTLRVAWDHDWFGIQGTVEHVWKVIEPIFIKLKDGLVSASTWAISLVWEGVKWAGEKIAVTYEAIKDWVLEELALGKSPLEIVVDVAKIVGGIVWDGLTWVGEKIALGTQIVFDWVADQTGDAIEIVIDAGIVVGGVTWQGLKWIGTEIVDIIAGRSIAVSMFQLVSDWVNGELDEEVEVLVEVAKAIGGVIWGGLTWIGEKTFDLAVVVKDFVVSEIDTGFEQTIEVAKVVGSIVWGGLKWAAGKAVSFIDELKKKITEAGIIDEDKEVSAGKVIGLVIWEGLKWAGEKITLGLKMFEDWVRDQLDLPETATLPEVFLDMVRVVGTAVWDGLKWVGQKVAIGAKEVYDWASEGLEAGFELTIEVAKVFGGVVWQGLVKLGEWSYDAAVWAKDNVLPTIVETTIEVGKVIGGISWLGLKWVGSQIAIGFDTLKKWVYSELGLDKYGATSNILIEVAKVFGGLGWLGLKWTGEKIVLGYEALKKWTEDQLGTTPVDIILNVAKVTGTAIWEGVKWIDDKLPKIDLGADDEQKVDQGIVDVVVSAIANIASWQWRGFVWLTEKASFGLDWIADQIRPKINVEVNGDDNSGFDIGDIGVFAKGVAKVFSMKWEAVKWLWTKVTQSTFIEDLKNRIKKSSGIDDEVEVTWKDLLVRGFGSIGSAVWDGLTWVAEGPVHTFANWVREKIGMTPNGEMEVNLGDDIKVMLSGAVSSTTWLVDWITQGIDVATEWLQDIGEVMRNAVEGVVMSLEDKKLYETMASLGVKLGEFLGSGIKVGLNLLDIIQSALAGVIAEMTGSKEVGQITGTAIPLYFTAKWLMTPLATLTPYLVAAMGFAGLKPLAFGTFGVMVALRIAQELSTGEAEWQDIGARFVTALAAGMGIGTFLGSPSAGVLTFELLMLVKVEKLVDSVGNVVKSLVDSILFPEFIDLPVSEKMQKTINSLLKLDETLDRPADNLATWLIAVDDALKGFYNTFPTKVELDKMGEQEQSYFLKVLEYAHALEASSEAILGAAEDLEATARMIENMRQLVIPIPGKAEGGYISGPGGPTDDLIPAMLSDGEFVVNAKATERWLPFLKAINAQGFSMGGLAGLKKQIKGFATGGRAMAGESGVEPVTWWDVISNALKGVLGDFTETAKKDLGMLKDVFSDLLRTIGLDIDSSTQEMKDLVSQMENLKMPAFETDSSHKDFMVSLGLAARKIDAISSLLDETKLEKLNRQMGFIDAEMGALEKAFTEGEIGISEYAERIKYLSNISHNLGLSLEALNKKIERSSIVGDASEIFEVDENGDLKSIFNELRPGMEGLTDVMGNLSTAGEMFAVGLLNQVVNLEAINMLLNPITTILTGVMEILGPIINLLKPLGDALISIGRVFALTFNLFGQGLLVLQPFFKALGWLGATISYIADQIVLFVDGIFTWLSTLPFIGGLFSPLLTEDQRQSMKRTIPERMEDIELPQSTTGQVFQAGSSQHITNNYHFEFRGNDILTEDDESARRFADLIYKNLRDRGVQLQVG